MATRKWNEANMGGRFSGLMQRLMHRTENIATRHLPGQMPEGAGGASKRRLTRGFPIWAILAIKPRAGRNARPYPRKFSSARS